MPSDRTKQRLWTVGVLLAMAVVGCALARVSVEFIDAQATNGREAE